MAKKKSSRVSIQIMDPKLANVDTAADETILSKAKIESSKQVQLDNPAIIISRLNYPECVKYMGEDFPVPPRAKLKIADHTKLGPVPNGVLVKKLK